MRTGRVGLLAAVCGCALLLGGCEVVEEELAQYGVGVPQETTLQMKEDGTVLETVIDRLDQSYYNSSELESMISQTVSDYNQGHTADSVVIDEYTVEENQVLLRMTYRSANDYAEYNNVRFYNGSMLGAEMEGFHFLNQFWQVENGETVGNPVSNEVPLKEKQQQVLVTDTSHVVEVPGKVLYVSINGTPTGRRTVSPAADDIVIEQETQVGLVLPSSAVYIPEETRAKADADAQEKNYLYVIYEF